MRCSAFTWGFGLGFGSGSMPWAYPRLDRAETFNFDPANVPLDQRSDPFGRAGHDQVAGPQFDGMRQDRDDLGHRPDQIGKIGVLFYGTIHRKPDVALGGMSDSVDRAHRPDDSRTVERLAPIPRAALFARLELKITARQIVAHGVAPDMSQGLVLRD